MSCCFNSYLEFTRCYSSEYFLSYILFNCLLLKFLVKLVLIKLHSLNGPQFHKNGFYSDVIKLAKLIKQIVQKKSSLPHIPFLKTTKYFLCWHAADLSSHSFRYSIPLDPHTPRLSVQLLKTGHTHSPAGFNFLPYWQTGAALLFPGTKMYTVTECPTMTLAFGCDMCVHIEYPYRPYTPKPSGQYATDANRVKLTRKPGSTYLTRNSWSIFNP